MALAPPTDEGMAMAMATKPFGEGLVLGKGVSIKGSHSKMVNTALFKKITKRGTLAPTVEMV